MPQLVTRIDEELDAAIEQLVREGVVASRSDAVRLALQQLVERHRRAEVGARIVAGYVARPQREDEGGWADAATALMIADEPW